MQNLKGEPQHAQVTQVASLCKLDGSRQFSYDHTSNMPIHWLQVALNNLHPNSLQDIEDN